jgi:hypothetical protein
MKNNHHSTRTLLCYFLNFSWAPIDLVGIDPKWKQEGDACKTASVEKQKWCLFDFL